MQRISNSRLAALSAGLALTGSLALTSAPAQAHTSSKTYKTGAVALGVLGAVLLSKGNTIAGAAALGGGVLAYQKGRQVQHQEQRYDRYRYGYNGNANAYGYGYNGGYAPDYRYNDGGRYDNGGRGSDGWQGNAQFRPQRGNNGHHYGQYKHDRRDNDGHDRDDD